MGSIAYGTVIQNSGVEKEYYRAIKTYILSLNSRITCASDPDEEFDIDTKGSSYVPTLNFSIDGTHIFKIYRPAALGQNVFSICVAMDAVNGIPDSACEIYFRADGYHENWDKVAYNTAFDRGLVISHIQNGSLIYLSFTCWNETQGNRNTCNMSILHIKSDNSVLLSSVKQQSGYNKTVCLNLSNRTLYRASDLASGTFLSRFSYACPPGTIDYIKSSIYQNNNEKVFENRAIYDSTTVAVGDTVSLKDGAYAAVGTHQLVKVS